MSVTLRVGGVRRRSGQDIPGEDVDDGRVARNRDQVKDVDAGITIGLDGRDDLRGVALVDEVRKRLVEAAVVAGDQGSLSAATAGSALGSTYARPATGNVDRPAARAAPRIAGICSAMRSAPGAPKM